MTEHRKTHRATLSGLPLECVGTDGYWNGWACPIMTAEQVEAFACMIVLYARNGWDHESFHGEPAPADAWNPRDLFHRLADGTYTAGRGLTFEIDTKDGFTHIY
jgi:hypothetical protein